mgnify:CR=1 FL=1
MGVFVQVSGRHFSVFLYRNNVTRHGLSILFVVISPIIKANFPFRIVLRLAGAGDKKVMDCKGARRLIPPGDALANLKGGLGEDPCTVF